MHIHLSAKTDVKLASTNFFPFSGENNYHIFHFVPPSVVILGYFQEEANWSKYELGVAELFGYFLRLSKALVPSRYQLSSIKSYTLIDEIKFLHSFFLTRSRAE